MIHIYSYVYHTHYMQLLNEYYAFSYCMGKQRISLDDINASKAIALDTSKAFT